MGTLELGPEARQRPPLLMALGSAVRSPVTSPRPRESGEAEGGEIVEEPRDLNSQ